jgi:protein-tyrosine phosphatase
MSETGVLPRTILFLCSGNYYRSRFAELVFNARAELAGLGWVATSAGLLPADLLAELDPISPSVLERLRSLGMVLDGRPRSPRSACRADFESAHRVIALKEAEHRPLMRRNFPDWEDRIVYWTVHDVDVAPPSETLPLIERAVDDLVEELGKV